MILKTVEIENYRNYKKEYIILNKDINLFIGGNGHGKTNFLEIVYYLALGTSFRSNKDSEIINWDKNYFKIKGVLYKESEKRDFTIEILIDREGNKRIKINGVIYKKLADLMGYLQVIIFTPDDLNIIKEGPKERRKYIDLEICQIANGYYTILSDYYKVLKQRNNLLKEISYNPKNSGNNTLEIWDEQLIILGSKIIKQRIDFLKKIVPLTRKFQWEISEGQEKLDITYSSVLINNSEQTLDSIIENFRFLMNEKRSQELRKGITLVGPHRDDIIFYLNGRDIKKYGSQGQQRSTILSLKLAELNLFYYDTGDYPILLLDDVMSELDDLRRGYLLKTIRNNNIQTLITGANLELMDNSFSNEIYYVKKGKIIKKVK